MGTLEANRKLWRKKRYWRGRRQGDAWSAPWGSTEAMWGATILPRIRSFVPAASILEIAPGYGRCTQYLKDLCEHLTLVDLAENCIEACRQRFSASKHITYHVNDGKSLAMIPDNSVDFVFSYDSLVHAEADVVEVYLDQLTRKLTPDGVGFIHHSNIGAYRNSRNKLRFYIDNGLNGSNWRAESMTARAFEEYCRQAGLQCISQELVNWHPRYSLRFIRPGGLLQRWSQKAKLEPISETLIERFSWVLNDCFSVFTLENSKWARDNKVLLNKRFMDEVRYIARLSELYTFS
jgi:2-polyprenyl-3-methyl-5-hydroxy-6-metoxy-1,4-benzoquinol methylase